MGPNCRPQHHSENKPKNTSYEQRLEARRKRLLLRASKTKAFQDPCIRAAKEDDDGYDPYSDRQEVKHTFERNPWN